MSIAEHENSREGEERASRYELLLRIASGATATVYVAKSSDLDRIVAVKRAHRHLILEPGARKNLLDEARLASRIRHANVASVQDVEESSHEFLLVMEYVEGGSLSELLEVARASGYRIPPSVVVRIALDVGQGLAALHEFVDSDGSPLGMLHRDVSPQNVLVGLDGTTRVADFGLAKVTNKDVTTTTTGTVKGKLAYLAPELLDGERASSKSELFALGVVVWEALASQRLFRGDTDADTLRRVMMARVPLISTVAPLVGRNFDDVLARALSRNPTTRQASVRAFVSEFEAAARAANLIGTNSEVSAVVEALLGANLARRRELIGSALTLSADTRETPAPLHARAPLEVDLSPPARDELPTIPEEPDNRARFPEDTGETRVMVRAPRARTPLDKRVLLAAAVLSVTILGAALAVVWPRADAEPTPEGPSMSAAPREVLVDPVPALTADERASTPTVGSAAPGSRTSVATTPAAEAPTALAPPAPPSEATEAAEARVRDESLMTPGEVSVVPTSTSPRPSAKPPANPYKKRRR